MEPSAMEVEFLRLLNEARADPVAYGRSVGVDLTGYVPRPPLVMDARLFDAARFKSQEMLDHRYFAHTSPITGKTAIELARERGYALRTVGESIAGGPWTPAGVLRAWVVDAGVPSLGHRKQLLGAPGYFSADHVHAGVGAAGMIGPGGWSGYWTCHTAVGDVLQPIGPPPPAPMPTPGVTFRGFDATSKGDGPAGTSAVDYTAPSAAAWTWAASTTDRRAVPTVTRAAVCDYHTVGFEVVPPADLRRVDVYCLDWDSGGRRQRVDLVDRTTGAVLDSRTLENFIGGVWLSWDVDRPVKVRVTRLAGPNCVVSDVRGF